MGEAARKAKAERAARARQVVATYRRGKVVLAAQVDGAEEAEELGHDALKWFGRVDAMRVGEFRDEDNDDFRDRFAVPEEASGKWVVLDRDGTLLSVTDERPPGLMPVAARTTSVLWFVPDGEPFTLASSMDRPYGGEDPRVALAGLVRVDDLGEVVCPADVGVVIQTFMAREHEGMLHLGSDRTYEELARSMTGHRAHLDHLVHALVGREDVPLMGKADLSCVLHGRDPDPDEDLGPDLFFEDVASDCRALAAHPPAAWMLSRLLPDLEAVVLPGHTGHGFAVATATERARTASRPDLLPGPDAVAIPVDRDHPDDRHVLAAVDAMCAREPPVVRSGKTTWLRDGPFTLMVDQDVTGMAVAWTTGSPPAVAGDDLRTEALVGFGFVRRLEEAEEPASGATLSDLSFFYELPDDDLVPLMSQGLLVAAHGRGRSLADFCASFAQALREDGARLSDMVPAYAETVTRYMEATGDPTPTMRRRTLEILDRVGGTACPELVALLGPVSDALTIMEDDAFDLVSFYEPDAHVGADDGAEPPSDDVEPSSSEVPDAGDGQVEDDEDDEGILVDFTVGMDVQDEAGIEPELDLERDARMLADAVRSGATLFDLAWCVDAYATGTA